MRAACTGYIWLLCARGVELAQQKRERRRLQSSEQPAGGSCSGGDTTICSPAGRRARAGERAATLPAYRGECRNRSTVPTRRLNGNVAQRQAAFHSEFSSDGLYDGRRRRRAYLVFMFLFSTNILYFHSIFFYTDVFVNTFSYIYIYIYIALYLPVMNFI